MKRVVISAVAGLFCAGAWCYAQTNGAAESVALDFQEAPLSRTAELYSSLSKCPVTIEPGRYPVTTLRTKAPVSQAEAIRLIEEAWLSNGVVVLKRVFPCRIFLFPDASRVPEDQPDLEIFDSTNRIERRLIRKPWDLPEPTPDDSLVD